MTDLSRTKPGADSLASNVQRLGTGRASKSLWQVTIGLAAMVASCVAYAVDGPSSTLQVTPDSRKVPLKEALVDLRDRYEHEVSLADKRWENFSVTIRSSEATFHQALRDLLRDYSYYLVRHDPRRSTLYFSDSKIRYSDDSEFQYAMIERGRAHNEADWLDKEDWLEIWDEDAAEMDGVSLSGDQEVLVSEMYVNS